MQNIVKTINLKLKQNPNESIKEIFGETQTVLSLKQPPNLLRLLSKKNRRSPQDLLNCNNKNCKLCALYIKPCASFKASNNFSWYGRIHTTYQSKNVIYFLKRSSCNYSTIYIGKTVDLRSRMTSHITSCRLGGSTDKFDNHVFCCMQNQKQEPFFQILTFIKLADEQNLLFYEKLLQNRGYDTLNKP